MIVWCLIFMKWESRRNYIKEVNCCTRCDMKRFLCCIESHPKDINSQTWKQIFTLHQKSFNLEKNFIQQNMLSRDLVLLYYESDTNSLIGTACLQWIEQNNNVVLYLGGIVVEKKHRKATGILLRVISKAMQETFKKYPGMKKYVTGSVTTPQVYTLWRKYCNMWPKENQEFPAEIKQLIPLIKTLFTAENFNSDNYKITVSLPFDKKQGLSNKKDLMSYQKYQSYYDEFYRLNPAAENGQQLFCVSQLKYRNYLVVIILIQMRNIQITQKKVEKKLHHWLQLVKATKLRTKLIGIAIAALIPVSLIAFTD